jgi:tetratricopeptide (TPR) repeat protein
VKIQNELEKGRIEIAASEARDVLARHPDVPEAWLVEAHAKFRLAQREGDAYLMGNVIATLGAAQVQLPAHAWASKLLLDEIQAASGTPSTATSTVHAGQTVPDTPEAWYLRSFATLDADVARSAALRAGDAVTDGPVAGLIWSRLALLHRREGRYEEAWQAAQILMERGAERAWWTKFAAGVRARQGRYHDAIELLSGKVELTRTPAGIYSDRAGIRLCLRDYSKAIEDYSTAIRLADGPALWALYRRGTAYMANGQLLEAEQDWRDFCTHRGPGSYGEIRLFILLQHRARRLRLTGDATEAAQVEKEAAGLLEQSLTAAPPSAWLTRILRCLSGDLAPAELVAAAQSEGQETQICEALYYAGEASLLDGRERAACEWFAECVETGVVHDTMSDPFDPMNEWILARWRLDYFRPPDRGPGTPPPP